MLYYEGLTCPVCHKPFDTTKDDVVACPKCGLPHHRACWLLENRCHEEDKHGTEQEWNRNKVNTTPSKGHIPPDGQPKNAQICPYCYTKNAEFAEFCAHCGRALVAVEWHSKNTTPVEEYTPCPSYDFHTSASINGINENDLAAMVGVNTQYYIPRFHRIKNRQEGGWNWAAFLFGPLWLFYRKQYALGGLMFVFQTILDIASIWLMHPVNTAATESEMLLAMENLMQNPMMIPATCLSLLLLVTHVILGIKGNQLYLHHCCKRIRNAREETPDLSAAEIVSLGGVSIGMTMVFYLLSTILANGFAAWLLM